MILWAIIGIGVCLYGGALLNSLVTVIMNPFLGKLIGLDETTEKPVTIIMMIISCFMIVGGFQLFLWSVLESASMLW